MKYLQAMAFLLLIIRSDGKGTVIYIDGLHVIHSDMRGHDGVFATEGKGTMYSSSTKVKLNIISSTKTEIVAVGENLPKSMWVRLYRFAQGGYAQEDILMQESRAVCYWRTTVVSLQARAANYWNT